MTGSPLSRLKLFGNIYIWMVLVAGLAVCFFQSAPPAYGQTAPPSHSPYTGPTLPANANAGQCTAAFNVDGSGPVTIGLSELGTLPAGVEPGSLVVHRLEEPSSWLLINSSYNAATQQFNFTADRSGVYTFCVSAATQPGTGITNTGGGPAATPLLLWLALALLAAGLVGGGWWLKRTHRYDG